MDKPRLPAGFVPLSPFTATCIEDKAEPRSLQLAQPCQLANPSGTGVMACPQAWDSIFSSPPAPSHCPLQGGEHHKGGR